VKLVELRSGLAAAARGRVSFRLVTLVAPNDRSRTAVARYLERSGFQVRRPRVSDTACTMVWLTDHDGDLSEAADAITAWLEENGSRHAVVVTPRPVAFRVLREAHRRRLVILPAPAFGWQIVDALWATHRRDTV
jgi:hypothetical protein